MPKINEMLLKLEGFQHATSWDIIRSHIEKTLVTYVRLLSCEENIGTSVYQWELRTQHTFSNRK